MRANVSCQVAKQAQMAVRLLCCYRARPNAWRISRAAPSDRDGVPGDSNRQNRNDLGPRAASGCMRWLGGTTPEGRADLPAVMACAGVPRERLRGQSSPTLVDATTVGCVPRDDARGRCRRSGSHQDGGRMRALGSRARAFPALACPGRGCVPCDGARMRHSHGLAVGSQQSRG